MILLRRFILLTNLIVRRFFLSCIASIVKMFFFNHTDSVTDFSWSCDNKYMAFTQKDCNEIITAVIGTHITRSSTIIPEACIFYIYFMQVFLQAAEKWSNLYSSLDCTNCCWFFKPEHGCWRW